VSDLQEFACIDYQREQRCGFPEVVFAQGKTAEQVTALLAALADAHDVALATRVGAQQAAFVTAQLPDATYIPSCRLLYIDHRDCALRMTGATAIAALTSGGDAACASVVPCAASTILPAIAPAAQPDAPVVPLVDKTDVPAPAVQPNAPTPLAGKIDAPQGDVFVCCAGTSDLPVAEEAALTARIMGSRASLLVDAGIAGVHRVLAHEDRLRAARCIVAVAGMEGALPSLVAGLVDVPVIAVPTSVGYGASFGGLAALLGMLNSCASGVSVVNIDNGFGAGVIAHRINVPPRCRAPQG
jgi:NCAIR mutase (PurE)-related protein